MVIIYLISRYERFWHGLQTALISILRVTGCEGDGLYTLLRFKTAVEVHNFVGLTLSQILQPLQAVSSQSPNAVLPAFAGRALPFVCQGKRRLKSCFPPFVSIF